jgi:hypothetical protein
MRATVRRMLKQQRYERWFERSRPSYKRDEMRDLAEFCDEIRAWLAEAGIDPARCRTLRTGDEAAATLAAIPDTPELRRLDAEILAQDPEPDDDEPAPVWNTTWRTCGAPPRLMPTARSRISPAAR